LPDLLTTRQDEFVAPFVYHGFALETLVALATQAPNAVLAHFAQCRASEPFRLVLMSVDQVNLAPSASTTTIYGTIFACTQSARTLGYVGEHMHDQLALLVQIVQPNCFVQFDLTAQRAWIAFLVDPFYSEQLLLVKLADISQQLNKLVQLEIVSDVNDHDETTVVHLHFDIIFVRVKCVQLLLLLLLLLLLDVVLIGAGVFM